MKYILLLLMVVTPRTFASRFLRQSNETTQVDHTVDGVNATRRLDHALDALIIGSGWAGLGAARKLQSSGVTNFQVLEGRDYVGGRSATIPVEGENAFVELGSEWIHGVSTSNPVYRLALQARIAVMKSQDTGGTWSNVYGSNVPHEISDADIDDIQDMFNDFMNFQARLQYSTNYDTSLQNVANQFIQNRGISGDDLLGFQAALDSNIIEEFSSSLEDMSLWWWDMGSYISGGDGVLTQVGSPNQKVGYSGVVDYFAGPVASKIQLNSKVTSIDWTTAPVVVTYVQDGVERQLQANNVIVTVPVSVLQQNRISFTPSLPRRKRNALNKIGMGSYNKCILVWDDDADLPWPSGEWLEKIGEVSQIGRWTTFYNQQARQGKNILVAFAAGRQGKAIESLTDAQIQAEVMESLADMFGPNAVPPPKKVIIKKWGTDEFALGSYSYMKVGAKPRHRKILAEPLDNRLYFAGEATHSQYPSTTHGALLSGRTAGNMVAQKFGRRKLLAGKLFSKEDDY